MKPEPWYNPRKQKPAATPKTKQTGKELSTLGKIKIALAIRRTINNIPQPMKINASWKTSLFGTTGLLTVLFNVANMLMDDNPATNPDWGVTITLILTSVSAIFAKDRNVSNAPHPTAEAHTVK